MNTTTTNPTIKILRKALDTNAAERRNILAALEACGISVGGEQERAGRRPRGSSQEIVAIIRKMKGDFTVADVQAAAERAKVSDSSKAACYNAINVYRDHLRIIRPGIGRATAVYRNK